MSETKRISAEVVDVKGGDTGGWTAVASTPCLDHDGESLAAGCFSPLPKTIPVHVDHRLSIENLVGRARPYYDGSRLMLDGVFAGTPKAQEVRQLVAEGFLDAMSVVFVDAQRKMVGNVRTVVKGTLKACDFVTIGANPEARLVSARSLDGELAFMALKGQLLQLQIELDEMTLADSRKAIADVRAFLGALEGGRRP